MNTEEERQIGRDIFREAHDSFVIVQPADLRVLDVNPAVQRLTKLRRKQLLSMTLLDLFETEGSSMLEEIIRACQTTSYFAPREGYYLKNHAGSPIPVHVTVSRIHIDPDPLALLVVRDISKDRQRKELLREKENWLQLAQGAAGVGFYDWDIKANLAQCCHVYWQLYGLLPSETPATLEDWLGRVHVEDRARCKEEVRLALDERVPYETEFRVVWPDGSVHWLNDKAKVFFDDAGRPTRMIGAQTNITDRVRAEEQRRKLESQFQHTQRLESLGVLAGGIAHDFNNCLVSIVGYADLALNELPSRSTAGQFISELVNSSRQATELVKQLLAYSGKGRFVVQPVNLSTLTQDIARMLEISVSKKCEVRYDLTPDPPVIEADVAQIRQVIMNLIINASEAIVDPGGVVTISTGVTLCDHDFLAGCYNAANLQEGSFVYLEVADTGCGMSEQQQARIFEPFFTTKDTGRGLGLAAVLGIVRGHRGAIKCSSELGKGTSIQILFPVATLPGKILEKHGPQGEEWRGSGTVLVVDDDESVRAVARHMLEVMGFAVLTAAGGREAIEMLGPKGNQIRLVLLDLTMPDLDGEQTFHEMRRLRPDVRVILSSGYSEQAATSPFVKNGPSGFVPKPYRFEELKAAVRKVIR